jgi:hypothetical protein
MPGVTLRGFKTALTVQLKTQEAKNELLEDENELLEDENEILRAEVAELKDEVDRMQAASADDQAVPELPDSMLAECSCATSSTSHPTPPPCSEPSATANRSLSQATGIPRTGQQR